MPAVLTHKTIMLMARERLAAIRDALNAKLLRGGPKSDLEHRVMFLADQAHRMMTDLTLSQRGVLFPLGADYTTPLGQDVSPYAVMGSMGPDLTAFSAMLARGQSWVFDTVHKGNPDQNREPVVARTTDFALELWNQIGIHAAAGRASADDERRMRAYVLGHLCHVAADVVSHPYINDLEWHLGNRSRPKLSHGGGEGSIDARVARQILLRRSTREGQEWDKWWPTRDEVPEVFFAAYTDALDLVYRARSDDTRPKGFGEFEAKFTERESPSMTLDFVKDGYRLYRHGILSLGYGWGYGSWFGALVPMVIPASVVIALSGALPHSREFFTRRFQDVSERGWFELFTLPLAVGSIIPVSYGIWLATLTTRGVEGLTGAGIAFGVVSLILAVVFFSTVGMSDADLPWWARWFFLFAPLAAIPLVFASIGLADMGRDDGGRRGALGLIYGLPIAIWLVFILGFLIVTMGLGILAQLLADAIAGSDDTPGDVVGVVFYVLGMLVLTAALIVLWILLPKALRDAKIPEEPSPFSADRPHFVRLFDDSTLSHDPALATPTAQQLFYPSARRPLLKLWWEGADDLYVRSEQRQLAFSTTGQGAPTRVVPAPIVPMTVSEYAAALALAVPGLHAEPVYPADAPNEYHLPTGATFSEEAGEDDEEEGLPDSVATYQKLEKTREAANYVLRHADKPYQAVRFGRRGPVETVTPEDENTSGPGQVTSDGTTVTGTGTVFGYFFSPGDQVGVGTQVRVVTQVRSDTELEISAPFDPAITAASAYLRLGPGRERMEGYTYLSSPATARAVGGGSVMDLAADLAVLLCLGMTPHLLPSADRRVPSLAGQTAAAGGAAIDASVGKVYQVFRNWSLDRRRVNEWRTIVAGSARSEKAAANEYDAAMRQPQPPAADWQAANVVQAGEPVANAQGWVPVLRQWMERVGAGNATDAAAPVGGGPSNLALSQAMAFLLDLKPPTQLA